MLSDIIGIALFILVVLGMYPVSLVILGLERSKTEKEEKARKADERATLREQKKVARLKTR